MAGRHARYSQNGTPIFGQPNATKTFNANTWKLGLVWDLNEQLTARFTRSRDFRAPNLQDLYAPGVISASTGFPDTLTGITVNTLAANRRQSQPGTGDWQHGLTGHRV